MSDKDDPLSFLEDGEATASAADEGQATKEQAEATDQAPSEASTDADGGQQQPPAETGETNAPPPGAEGGGQPDAEKRGEIPISALLDEREKRQKLERELAELRQKAEARRDQDQAPDPERDPQGYNAYRDRQFQQQLWNERLNMSEVMTRQSLGDEVVDEATKAFQQAVSEKPWLAQELQRQQNPYGYVVEWHRQQRLLSEIGNDPEKWREAERERLKAELQAEMQAQAPGADQPPAQQQAPSRGIPRSLARAPAAGSDAASSAQTSGFEKLFPE